MQLPNSNRQPRTDSIAISGEHLLKRWKKNIRRLRPSPGPNYCRMASHSTKMALQTRRRIMRFAPLLFNKIAIEREVAKRIRAVNKNLSQLHCFQTDRWKELAGSSPPNILAYAPDHLTLLKKKFRKDVVDQAWEKLSPTELRILQLEWKVYLLAADVGLKACEAFRIKVDPKKVTFSDYMDLVLAACEFIDIGCWNTPPQLDQLNTRYADHLQENALGGVTKKVGGQSSTPQNPCSPDNQASTPDDSAQTKELEESQKHCSNKIIRLTTYLSALHVAEGDTPSPNQPAPAIAV